MLKLSNIPAKDLARELRERMEAARTKDEQDALLDVTMFEIPLMIAAAQRYQNIPPRHRPLDNTAPGLLVNALNRLLGDKESWKDPAALTKLFEGANRLTKAIETAAAQRWFANAKSLGAALGQLPPGIQGIRNGSGTMMPAQLLSIAADRLKSLIGELSHLASPTNNAVADELVWWYGIVYGLMSVADHDSAFSGSNAESVDTEIVVLELAMAITRRTIESWGDKYEATDGGADCEAEELKLLFVNLRCRLAKARHEADEAALAR